MLPLQDQADGSWQDKLHRLLAEARVEHYFERACSVCDDLGVAFFSELLQNGDDIASRLRMKKLKRERFVQSIAATLAVRYRRRVIVDLIYRRQDFLMSAPSIST